MNQRFGCVAIYLAVALFAGVCARAVSSERSGQSAPLSGKYDCTIFANLDLPPEGITLNLVDSTSAPKQGNLATLHSVACKAAAAAVRAAADEGISTPWVNGLPIELVDEIDGMKDQAYFQRNLVGKPARSIQVGVALLEARFAKRALFILGHELGHGVYGHAAKKKAMRIAALWTAGGGAVAAIAKRGAVRVAGAAVAVGAGAAGACMPGAMSIRYELESDLFALRVMVQAGLPLKEAQAEAIALFKSHPENEPGCVKDSHGRYGLPNDKRHPGTADRIRAIERMSRNE